MFELKEFGPASPSDTPYPLITIAGTKVENYFAPEDDVAEKIIAQLKRAEESIFFLIFVFTDEEIAEVVMAKAKEGVLVRGVFEKRGAESRYSRYPLMRRRGLDVCADGNPYLMHHKVIIVDEETVILGSFNFTRSADELNDENILIIHDRGVAALYLEEFWRIYKQGVGALLRQPQAS
jgi:phosphatidylserine/phosphatidylglycerophosphate/cardiolipin synthase-like enzyme